MGETVFSQAYLLPPPAWFVPLLEAQRVVLLDQVRYTKQTWHNRYYIAGPNGLQALVVPVKHTGLPKMVNECEPDYSQRWAINHWRSIQTAYGKAPFFEFYAPQMELLLKKEYAWLVDMQVATLSFCLKSLKINAEIERFNSYLTADVGINQQKEVHSAMELATKWVEIPLISYQQVFGREFEEEVSILDLLFCLGPAAHSHLRLMQQSQGRQKDD